ncbi:MAG: aminoacyl-tRNA hydrolase [Chloroflexi bacterium]|nr:aminoacyl-tRNA hydrolase [Chloroflexota bacterium]
MTERYLLVGLGNPGREYEDTRHNVGFRCVDAVARAYHLSFQPKKQSKAKIADGTIAGRRVLLAKPQAYMNLSGGTVQGLATFYKIPPAHILVIFDDLDLPLGTLRIRQKGGSGGHRGLTDIIQRLGTQDFPRIRFGIGRPPGRMDPAAFVLQRFSPAELDLVNAAVATTVEAVETWLRDGIDIAMNRYNGAVEGLPRRESAPDSTPDPAQPNE